MMNTPSIQLQASPTFAESGWGFLPAPHRPATLHHAAAAVSFEFRSEGAPLWRESIALLEQHVQFARRKYRTGEMIYLSGHPFDTVYVVGSGMCKEVNLMPDGREQATGLQFRGDWLGFDGIPTGRHCCYAAALEPSEVWAIGYTTLMQVCTQEPALMQLVLAAISSQLARTRDAMMTMGTLNADARVGYFLLQWARCLQARGQRTDLISVRMSRADIASHLGMRVESVSRSLTKIAQSGAIEFNEPGRREIGIPSLEALQDFVQNQTDSVAMALN
jgi:CRP/FNR family transcriptional regulator